MPEETPELNLLDYAIEGLSEILKKAEKGDADPNEFGMDFRRVLADYFTGKTKDNEGIGEIPLHRLKEVSKPYEAHLIKAVNNYNDILEKQKEMPRALQKKSKILEILEKAIDELIENPFLKSSLEEASKEITMELTNEEKEALTPGRILETIARRYVKPLTEEEKEAEE